MKSEAIDQQIWEPRSENGPEQGVHLLDFLIILSKRRKFIFLFTIGAAVLGVLVALILPNMYIAVTLILPPAQNPSASSALLGQLGGSSSLASVASLGMRNPGDMYVSLLRSRTVEDAVIQRFKLMNRYRSKNLSDARQKFEERSNVVLGIKDGLILISVADHDPNQAADIANGYVDEFRKFSANLAITEASQRRAFFQQQLLEAHEKLATAEEAMKHTEQATGVLQVDSQAKSLIESAELIRSQIGMKEVELQGIRSYATEDNPQVVMGEQQLAALKRQLAQLAGTDQNSTSDMMVPGGKIAGAGMEYIRRLRDVKYYETIAELIGRQLEVAKQDEARQGAIVQVTDVAVPPDKKSSPHRAIIVLLITLVAFLTAVLWVLGQARWMQATRDPVNEQKLRTLRMLLFNQER
jgi:tyrosine-protein kinase Etk/Wzc